MTTRSFSRSDSTPPITKNSTIKFNDHLPFMNHKRNGCAAAAQAGKIFVMGGGKHLGGKTAEMYDTHTQQWTPIDSMRTSRDCAAAVSFGDSVVVMGGYDNEAIRQTFYKGTQTMSVEKYDLISQQWSFLPPMNSRRCGCAAAVVGGKIIVVGGFDSENWTASGEEYNPHTRKWSGIAPMRNGRAFFAAAEHEGKLYVFGGHNGYKALSSAEVYDPATNSWRKIRDMPTPRERCSAVSVAGKIIVIGGKNERERCLSSCAVYDPTTRRWSSDIVSMNTERQNCAAVEVGGTIFVMGGTGKKCNLSMVALPCYTFLLDEKPNLAKEIDIDVNLAPIFLSFIRRKYKFLTLWEVIRNSQDLLSDELLTVSVTATVAEKTPPKKKRLTLQLLTLHRKRI